MSYSETKTKNRVWGHREDTRQRRKQLAEHASWKGWFSLTPPSPTLQRHPNWHCRRPKRLACCSGNTCCCWTRLHETLLLCSKCPAAYPGCNFGSRCPHPWPIKATTSASSIGIKHSHFTFPRLKARDGQLERMETQLFSHRSAYCWQFIFRIPWKNFLRFFPTLHAFSSPAATSS